jgi:hypothetical protein
MTFVYLLNGFSQSSPQALIQQAADEPRTNPLPGGVIDFYLVIANILMP